MKPLKTIGLVAGILVMCATFAYVGSMISHWDDPVRANVQSPNVQKAPSSVQSAAVAAAQESTELTQ
jgi:hypothetical protein